MLKDYLLNWCQSEINSCITGRCGSHCDNQVHCTHDCNDCLDQVHWYPSQQGRSDYTCKNLLLHYVLRFANKYSGQITSALNVIDQASYPEFHILSIGCGETPDLMAFEKTSNKPIYYCGYDRNPFWDEIHEQIENYAFNVPGIDVDLHREDIFQVLHSDVFGTACHNVIVIQYLLSHLFNTDQEHLTTQLFNALIDRVISNRLPNSPFLIIITDVDSMNKGRNRWFTFLDMLETVGYHGTAHARSAFPTGDLGQTRWSNHRNSAEFGNIRYYYTQNDSERVGAQLIIELR